MPKVAEETTSGKPAFEDLDEDGVTETQSKRSPDEKQLLGQKRTHSEADQTALLEDCNKRLKVA